MMSRALLTSLRYWIVATGTSGIPNTRTLFCSVVSRAPDDSSFQITMYGGKSGPYYDDVWVLSIPSFQWIRVNDTNNHERISNGAGAGRKGHTCAIWNDSQMIVLGGMYASNAATQIQGDGNKSVCDTSYSPIRVLDTSDYSWKTEFQPNKAYSVPSTISDIIGGEYVYGTRYESCTSINDVLVLLATAISNRLLGVGMTRPLSIFSHEPCHD